MPGLPHLSNMNSRSDSVTLYFALPRRLFVRGFSFSIVFPHPTSASLLP